MFSDSSGDQKYKSKVSGGDSKSEAQKENVLGLSLTWWLLTIQALAFLGSQTHPPVSTLAVTQCSPICHSVSGLSHGGVFYVSASKFPLSFEDNSHWIRVTLIQHGLILTFKDPISK